MKALQMERTKFAIVRVPEARVIEFFATIASKGFTDVAFVNSLQQAAFTSLASVDGGFFGAEKPAPAVSPSSNNSGGVTNGVTLPPLTPSPPPAATASTNNATPLNLSEIFGFPLQNVNSNEETDFPFLFDVKPNIAQCSENNAEEQNGRPYHQRMKGWQRTYLSEMLKDGYPSDEKMAEAMQKCDLSRRQILRFISKRMHNPNKLARADWRAARASEGMNQIASAEQLTSQIASFAASNDLAFDDDPPAGDDEELKLE